MAIMELFVPDGFIGDITTAIRSQWPTQTSGMSDAETHTFVLKALLKPVVARHTDSNVSNQPVIDAESEVAAKQRSLDTARRDHGDARETARQALDVIFDQIGRP